MLLFCIFFRQKFQQPVLHNCTMAEFLLDFSNWLDNKLKNQKDDVSAACNDFLKVLGYVALGFSWLKMTKVSYENSSKNKEFFSKYDAIV